VAYARRRNYLDGPVTRLSPYITHGLIDVPDAVHALRVRHRPSALAKIEFEFAWREYFHHVWRHAEDGILSDLRSPPSGARYLSAIPNDILEARTGVPVVDESVRTLYRTGYLHNHQRMWLASYIIHLRKVHWRAGADWMVGHLLDGDLASNHLSWQWVAGTFSHKPYLFNADNVARYAPALASRGTAVDASYAALGELARSSLAVGGEPGAPVSGGAPPPLRATPPDDRVASQIPPTAGRQVTLLHPWSLRRPNDDQPAIGLVHLPFHRQFPWSDHRWSFVLARLGAVCDAVWIGDGAELLHLLRGARSISMRATLNPGYRELSRMPGVAASPVPRLLPDPNPVCASFSRFWERAGRSGNRHGSKT
jgi:deoxyribodipyrimidine photo-lyase